MEMFSWRHYVVLALLVFIIFKLSYHFFLEWIKIKRRIKNGQMIEFLRFIEDYRADDRIFE